MYLLIHRKTQFVRKSIRISHLSIYLFIDNIH